MITLSNIANAQYGSVTGRKRKYPYSQIILSKVPALKSEILNKASEDLQKAELTQKRDEAAQSLAQSQEQFDKNLEEQKKEFDITLAETAKQHDENLQAQKDALDQSEKQAKVAAATQGGTLALGTAYVANKLFTQKAGEEVAKQVGEKVIENTGQQALTAEATPSLSGASETLTGTTAESGTAGIANATNATTTGGETGTAASTTTANTGGGPTLAGAGNVLAIIAAVDAMRQWQGQLDRPYEDRGAFAKFFSAPVTGGPAGLMEAAGVNSSNFFAKPMNRLAEAEEALVGKPLDQAFSGDIGGSVHSFVDAALDTPRAAWDVASDTVGTWLCTEVGRNVGLTDEDNSDLIKLRRHAFRNHKGWFRFYWTKGPQLVAQIAKKEPVSDFYRDLNEKMVKPCLDLIKSNDAEKAYELYKEITTDLFRRYTPEIAVQEE
jgi:hypothetical protein